MSLTVCAHQGTVESQVGALLNLSTIQKTVGLCGYSITAAFLPQEFTALVTKVSQEAMEKIKIDLAKKGTSLSLQEMDQVEAYTKQQVEGMLKLHCRILDSSRVRNAPPSIPWSMIGEWLGSWFKMS